MDARTRARRFLLVVVALSVPFWLAGAVAGRWLPATMPIALPMSGLMAFLPAAAALGLTWRDEGAPAARRLLARLGDVRRAKDWRWWAAAILVMPAVMALDYAVLRLTGRPLPAPHLPLALLPAFLAMFLAAGAGEELGWQGYLFPLLEDGRSALSASLILGAVWALWHLIPFFQTGHDAAWVAWHMAATVMVRAITVWIWLNAGRSVAAAVVFHAASNIGYFMFPNYGSHYDPAVAFAIEAALLAAVVAWWGPGLARGRA